MLKFSTDLEDFETLLKHFFQTDNPKFSYTKFDKASKRDIPDHIEQAKLVASQHK